MKTDWKRVFRKDIKEKLRKSQNEFNRYKSTQRIIYLQQAGNKLFSLIENILQIKYGKRIKNYQQLRHLVKDNKNDKQLLLQAVQLHYFYYNGELHMPYYDAEDIYKIVRNKIKGRI